MPAVRFEGKTHVFPDDFTDEDISRALSTLPPTATIRAAEPAGAFSQAIEGLDPNLRAALRTSGLQGAGDVVSGAVKGIGSTGGGLLQLLNRLIPGDESVKAELARDFAARTPVPEGTAENVGFAGERVGELAGAVGPLALNVGRRVLPFAARAGAGVKAAAGAVPKEAVSGLGGAAVGALLDDALGAVAGGALGAGAPKILRMILRHVSKRAGKKATEKIAADVGRDLAAAAGKGATAEGAAAAAGRGAASEGAAAASAAGPSIPPGLAPILPAGQRAMPGHIASGGTRTVELGAGAQVPVEGAGVGGLEDLLKRSLIDVGGPGGRRGLTVSEPLGVGASVPGAEDDLAALLLRSIEAASKRKGAAR